MKLFYVLVLFSIFTINAQTAAYPLNKEGKFKTYISKDTIPYNIGDKITIGLPANGDRYLFIFQGGATAGTAITSSEVEITKLISKGNKKTGFKMWAQFKGFGLLPVDVDIENAWKVGEIETVKPE